MQFQSFLVRVAVFCLASLMLIGCNLEEFEEEFDTEFTVPKPTEKLFGAQVHTQAKRFKMENDPQDAEHVEFLDASLTVLAPDGHDLSFMNKLDVFVCKSIEFDDCKDPDNGNLLLLATADEFSPGDTKRALDISYSGDLRGFSKDQRILLTWIVYPSSWYSWPESGITIQTNVRLLVELDLL